MRVGTAFIDRCLRAPAVRLVARLALTCPYWWGGLAKLLDFEAALKEADHFVGPGSAMAVACLTIVVELGASALIVFGRAVWLGAGCLAVFTLWATYLAHGFWRATDPLQHFRDFNAFLEHIGLVGGLLLAAALAQQKTERETG